MDARARDRQKRAGARQRAHARQRVSPGGARPRAGRVRGKGHAEGASADAGGPGASRGVDLPAGAPGSAEGWRCLLQGQEQERLLTGISPVSPGGHTAVGNLTPSRRETLLLRGHPGINVSLK